MKTIETLIIRNHLIEQKSWEHLDLIYVSHPNIGQDLDFDTFLS